MAETLGALKTIFTGNALFWYKGKRRRTKLKTWSEFKDVFVTRFIEKRDDEDFLDELRERMQGKGEPIAEFASKFQYIASNLQAPLSEDKLVRLARRNLHPDYQTYM